MLENYETHEHDILMLGAGGAGLRAAIAASAAGASVGVVCKSLLGKAHTVMAEGGIAASLGNLDPSDSWKVHFADTMFGGKYINDWKMVELFTKEAPERVYELERWGAIFDRTPEGSRIKLKKSDQELLWNGAKRRCHLSDDALRMARAMGLSPRSLIKNRPSRSEPWKAPVEDCFDPCQCRAADRGRMVVQLKEW